MKSLILAAGYATRLYPLTKNFPKPLLPVGGRSILDRLLADLDAIPVIDEHLIVTNATFYSQFERWRAEADYEKEIVLVDDTTTTNENRLGAVRDILHVIESLGLHDDLLVLAGDNVVDFSFAGLADFAREKGTSCITCHHEPALPALQKTGVLVADSDFRVEAIQEKPEAPASHWAVPPFTFTRPAICRSSPAPSTRAAATTPRAIWRPGSAGAPPCTPGCCPAGVTTSATSPPTRR